MNPEAVSKRVMRHPAWQAVRRATASIWIVGPELLRSLPLGLGMLVEA